MRFCVGNQRIDQAVRFLGHHRNTGVDVDRVKLVHPRAGDTPISPSCLAKRSARWDSLSAFETGASRLLEMRSSGSAVASFNRKSAKIDTVYSASPTVLRSRARDRDADHIMALSRGNVDKYPASARPYGWPSSERRDVQLRDDRGDFAVGSGPVPAWHSFVRGEALAPVMRD
jgi:hypothetical protein